MNHVPQITVLLWLTVSLAAAVGTVLRDRLPLLVLTSDQQRIVALGFVGAAVSEASLLVWGGFFRGMF